MPPGLPTPQGATSTPTTTTTPATPPFDPTTWRPARPNILITGTPGTGKTTLCTHLATTLGLRHLNIATHARLNNLFADYLPPPNDTHHLLEDAVLDSIEPLATTGALILDHHSTDWFPQRWPQLLVCLHASTHTLHDRLTARGYAPEKVQENVQAEIMRVVYEEAVDAYPQLDVMYLRSDTEQDMTDNVNKITAAWNELVNPMEPSRRSDYNVDADGA